MLLAIVICQYIRRRLVPYGTGPLLVCIITYRPNTCTPVLFIHSLQTKTWFIYGKTKSPV